jgi:hypothetical protein
LASLLLPDGKPELSGLANRRTDERSMQLEAVNSSYQGRAGSADLALATGRW